MLFEVATGVVTVTTTVPADEATGVMAVIDVMELTKKVPATVERIRRRRRGDKVPKIDRRRSGEGGTGYGDTRAPCRRSGRGADRLHNRKPRIKVLIDAEAGAGGPGRSLRRRHGNHHGPSRLKWSDRRDGRIGVDVESPNNRRRIRGNRGDYKCSEANLGGSGKTGAADGHVGARACAAAGQAEARSRWVRHTQTG